MARDNSQMGDEEWGGGGVVSGLRERECRERPRSESCADNGELCGTLLPLAIQLAKINRFRRSRELFSLLHKFASLATRQCVCVPKTTTAHCAYRQISWLSVTTQFFF